MLNILVKYLNGFLGATIIEKLEKYSAWRWGAEIKLF